MKLFKSEFYSHVNYSVTKMPPITRIKEYLFYSHVNYSVTKIGGYEIMGFLFVLQSRKLFSY